MKILIDKRINPYAINLRNNYTVKAVKAKKLLKEYTNGDYDILIGINVKKIVANGQTYIISVGNDYTNVAIDYRLNFPLSVDKIDRAVLKSGLTYTSKKYRSIIKTIESILNYKSEDAGNQFKLLSCIVRLICQTIYDDKLIPISQDQIDQIVAFSTIHDIGKIGLPDEILSTESTYTDEERKAMMQHPLMGAKLISDLMKNNKISNYIIAYNIIKYHHEKYDGTGYPSSLSGDNIPLEARIVALADVYDALVTKRIYKRAYSHHEALDIIKKDNGTHFDPYIVNCFLRNQETIRKLYEDDNLVEDYAYQNVNPDDNSNKVFVFVLIISIIIITFILLAIFRLLN